MKFDLVGKKCGGFTIKNKLDVNGLGNTINKSPVH